MPTFVRTQSIEQQIGTVGRLGIKVTSAETRIRAVEAGRARVRATFEIHASSEADADRVFAACQLTVSAGDRSLEVEEPERMGKMEVDLQLEIEAPPTCELRLEGVSADVSVDGLHGEQRYQTVSGDLLLKGAAGDVQVNTVSGDVTIRAESDLSLRTNAVSGDLSAMAPRFATLRANSVSGDVELEGAFDAAGQHRVETVSGDLGIGLLGGATFDVRGLSTDIHCRLPHQLQGQADRRRVVVGDGTSRFSFSSMSGDLSISAPRRLAAPADVPAASVKQPTDQLEILRALERGEIDVDEATRRLSSEAPQ
jgi:hypothetical protein